MFAKNTRYIMKGCVTVMQKVYNVPEQIIDAKEEKLLITLTETYNKMIEPSKASKAISKIGEKVPAVIKEKAGALKNEISENELFLKSMSVLSKGFEALEQYAAKVTLSEKQIVDRINQITPDNEITTLDEICLARSYDISKIVNKFKFADISASLVEGAATGAPGFAGIPFNLVLSTFLYYRAVQSIALFYGYDIKNDPAELQIASEVFMNALSPKNNNDSELSNTIAKIMLLTTATSVKQTVKKGWTAMAEKGGVYLLLAQMRALANNGVKKTLEKAGKKGLEKTAFTEIFEQIGRKLTQKTILKAVPAVGAFIGATLDTSQMIKIIQFADIFYNKRFILEKDIRINTLLGYASCIIDVEDYEDISDRDSVETYN